MDGPSSSAPPVPRRKPVAGVCLKCQEDTTAPFILAIFTVMNGERCHVNVALLQGKASSQAWLIRETVSDKSGHSLLLLVSISNPSPGCK